MFGAPIRKAWEKGIIVVMGMCDEYKELVIGYPLFLNEMPNECLNNCLLNVISFLFSDLENPNGFDSISNGIEVTTAILSAE